ncbi:membrane protein insertase YidC [Pseudoprimorskyibacter insulae]|uniref:Membrane protein insertase YidC n=1 Tax=Pseudoprimorskyibacter insulae TaxID=1695997 RepID=A0A2R8AP07_9RHOB|nr:membrane protein insertase YidC [Pseudoprimorskyibacter insulae]SPF77798.1 Membrane protein insertase YidC [Pseudoprimorskyibacter insulae]
MGDQNKNLILATVLSFVVILVWFLLFPPPEQTAPAPGAEAVELAPAPQAGVAGGPATTNADLANTASDVQTTIEAPRVSIDTQRLAGSISLTGGRVDELFLKDFRATLDEGSDIVQILFPVGSESPYYAFYGWAPGAGLGIDDVPGPNTAWQVEGNATLTEMAPVTLRWDSPAGMIFRRTMSVDEDFMFSVTQTVENTSGSTIALAPYGVIARHGEPKDGKKFFVLHEGLVGMADGQLTEDDYGNMADYSIIASEGAHAEVKQVNEAGWIGFTDHYWMSTLIPNTGEAFKSVAKYDETRDIYQAETVLPTQTLAAGQTASSTTRLFAGAKEWETIREYQNEGGVDRFIDSIDWGWFFFLTKPIFAVLHWLNKALIGLGVPGSMGWSIIGLTLLIKALLFPLAYKSYVSMAKMKELQPQMEKIKERTGDDRAKLQQEMMALYKKEKVNPASGCLPIILQIPIFFSLYKVIFVTMELRHAPWIGWIHDLSAPDPTSILNLFGLLPYAVPDLGPLQLLSLGIMPILLGISMYLQQKLNPAPADPTQKMIFAWMPWIFMFMLGSFASGLVLYWIANNTITFTQQYLIMRSQGYKPDVLGNIFGGKKDKAAAKK